MTEDSPPSSEQTIKSAKLIVEGYFDSTQIPLLRSYQASDENGDREVVEVHSIRQFHITRVIQGKIETDMVFINQIGGQYGSYSTDYIYNPEVNETIIIALVNSRYEPFGNRPVMKVMNNYIFRSTEDGAFEPIPKSIEKEKVESIVFNKESTKTAPSSQTTKQLEPTEKVSNLVILISIVLLLLSSFAVFRFLIKK